MPDDVIGVEVNGETALLSDGMFLVAGSSSSPDIGLIWEPERAALVEACDALAPLLRLEERVIPIDAPTADALMAASRATTEPAFANLAEVLAEPGQNGLDLEEIEASGGRITDTATEALLACEQADVPGWAIVYQEPAGPPGPPPPTVDLGAYGRRQDLSPTDATSDLIHGPGLAPVTRAEVGDTGVAAFTWERLNPNLQACLLVQLDGRSTQTCQDRDLSGAFLSMDQPAEADLQIQARSNERRASFATAEVDGQTWVQKAQGLYFVFVLPPGDVTITLHGPDGATLESATSEPSDDPSTDDGATTSSTPEGSGTSPIQVGEFEQACQAHLLEIQDQAPSGLDPALNETDATAKVFEPRFVNGDRIVVLFDDEHFYWCDVRAKGLSVSESGGGSATITAPLSEDQVQVVAQRRPPRLNPTAGL